jgi:hypothetical protein
MIKPIKNDISNNISFPASKRNVMLLIDGNYYRMEISKKMHYKETSKNGSEIFDSVGLHYDLCIEGQSDPIGKIFLFLYTSNNDLHSQERLELSGCKECPMNFFELKSIWVDESQRGIGTAFLSYVMNDIKKFNESQKRNIKIVLNRLNSDITIPFYNKFGARRNENAYMQLYSISDADCTYMIIDEPKIVGELPKELADDFDYSSIHYFNPFENQPQ